MINYQNIKNLIGPRYTAKYAIKRYRAKRAVKPVSRGEIPILVHQMGKVGSKTLVNSIKNSWVQLPVFHTHFITREGIANNWKTETNNYSNKRIPYHLLVTTELGKYILENPGREVIILSSIRELVSRQVSLLYQAPFLAKTKIRDKYGNIDPRLASKYLNKYMAEPGAFEYPERWFSQELEAPFGINVFDHAFDKEKGMVIIRKGSIRFMLVQMDKINELLPTEISAFLKAEKPVQVSNKNVRKVSSYSETRGKIKLTQATLDSIYNSKIMKHFYSEENLDRFKKKWS
jgi:hypothetical protein